MDAIRCWGLSHSKNVNKSFGKDKEDRGEGQKRKARGKWAGASLSQVDAVPCLIIDNVRTFVFFFNHCLK
ncbi:hypothetical protein DAI22_04g067300 [Oryza sativa Japonica Group]|nr:hypothetical protein DAI22_04g067300 [Oryza sativa Japonica Group]